MYLHCIHTIHKFLYIKTYGQQNPGSNQVACDNRYRYRKPINFVGVGPPKIGPRYEVHGIP